MSDTLHLDPVGGIAGDMFLAASLDLGVGLDALQSGLARLGLGRFRLDLTAGEGQGVRAVHVEVVVEGPQPHDRSYADIRAMIERSDLSARVREAAGRVFRCIGEAEALMHHCSIEEVHFHEVGAVDSIVDVVGAALCLEQLGWPRVLATPPPAGSGTVRSAHGMLPVPAPATLEIMRSRGRRLRPSGPGERTTPTGAALLAVLAEEVSSMPDLVIEKVGYGAGTKRWDDAPNVLRAVLGRAAAGHRAQACVLVEANLDDATGQLVAHAMEQVLAAGAVDVWAAPVTGRKGRPGFVLSALAGDAALEAVQRALVRETTTLGVRWTRWERLVLDREFRTVSTPWGDVPVKVGLLDGGPVNYAPEFDDCVRVARQAGVPVKEVVQAALAAVRQSAR